MNTGGGDAPPSNGGEFLLQLLRNPHPNPHTSTPALQQIFSHDPAVAAVGPPIPSFPSNAAAASDFPYHLWNINSSPQPFATHNYFHHQNPNPNLNPDFSSPPGGFNYGSINVQPIGPAPGDSVRRFVGDSSGQRVVQPRPHPHEHNLVFGSLGRDVLQNDGGNVSFERFVQRERFGSSHPGDGNSGVDRRSNGVAMNPDLISFLKSNISRGNHVQNGNQRSVAPPPDFASTVKNVGHVGQGYGTRTSDHNVDKGKGYFGDIDRNDPSRHQHDSPATSGGSRIRSASAFDVVESVVEVHGENADNGEVLSFGARGGMSGDRERNDLDDLEEQLVESLGLEDDSGEKSDKKKNFRDKEYRSDKRGQWIMGQRMRNQKKHTVCPNNIDRHNVQFLAVFESLIPAEEEKLKQKQLLKLLEKLVSKEWPEARLYLYGSCANSFGFPKSDIDVCLAMELGDIEKPEVLLKLADIFMADNLQNVQALTRARVPIVKLMDPVTGIFCDICINNVLAVVNTKLLRDYAQIDSRLRQLVFIVKHWAKSRGVNETYQGTLSSYAYVLMCIHFLQQRRPAILPCLQRMETTYFANVGNVECAYFDKVEKLGQFGSQNREGIAQLVWAFFHYWAYCHDYANDVISVRTGSTLSKRDKDWTRRVGNDRHLICIEDPFELSHDLGRVVDKYSIRVLREEFERAAQIMQYDPNPCVTLFEPYVPN